MKTFTAILLAVLLSLIHADASTLPREVSVWFSEARQLTITGATSDPDLPRDGRNTTGSQAINATFVSHRSIKAFQQFLFELPWNLVPTPSDPDTANADFDEGTTFSTKEIVNIKLVLKDGSTHRFLFIGNSDLLIRELRRHFNLPPNGKHYPRLELIGFLRKHKGEATKYSEEELKWDMSNFPKDN